VAYEIRKVEREKRKVNRKRRKKGGQNKMMGLDFSQG
jgi:hypothetical protein